MEQDFIKVILTKNQEKSKGDKEKMGIRKSRCVELDKTYCYTGKLNMTLSLYSVVATTYHKG